MPAKQDGRKEKGGKNYIKKKVRVSTWFLNFNGIPKETNELSLFDQVSHILMVLPIPYIRKQMLSCCNLFEENLY